MSAVGMRLLFFIVVLVGDVLAGVSLKVDGREAEFGEALIDCQLHGRFLVRTMELAFSNPGPRATEGELVCPLDEGERVVSFAMEVKGTRRSSVSRILRPMTRASA